MPTRRKHVLGGRIKAPSLAQRRHTSFEAIRRGTPSREHSGHTVLRILARSAVGIFIAHRQYTRKHLRHKSCRWLISSEKGVTRGPVEEHGVVL